MWPILYEHDEVRELISSFSISWLQIFALAKAFSTDPQRYRWCPPDNDKAVIPRLMKQYLVQLALCDEWRRVCLGEMRVGLGIVVMLSHFVGRLHLSLLTSLDNYESFYSRH